MDRVDSARWDVKAKMMWDPGWKETWKKRRPLGRTKSFESRMTLVNTVLTLCFWLSQWTELMQDVDTRGELAVGFMRPLWVILAIFLYSSSSSPSSSSLLSPPPPNSLSQMQALWNDRCVYYIDSSSHFTEYVLNVHTVHLKSLNS